MPASLPPPVARVDLALDLGTGSRDLGCRALVAAAVPAPRFARESEVTAAAIGAGNGGADLIDVSLEPRLIGAVAQASNLPVTARVATAGAAAAAVAAGAALLLVPPGLLDRAAVEAWPAAVVVDDLAALAAARAAAGSHGVPLAFDSGGSVGVDALADESVAIASGCRILRTTDVRRSRRVVEVLAALLEARRGR